MAIGRDYDFLMCFGSLGNILRIKFFFKGSYGSGKSIGHSGVSTEMKPSIALESGRTS